MERAALAWLLALEQFGIKFGLDNMRALTAALGHPEQQYRTIHIAGTNGKGSVTAMVDAALRAAGHRSARYTSPHLRDLNERFVIDGTAVSHETLEDAAAHLRRTVDDLRATGRLAALPTFFETTTALAFHLFRQAGVEIAVCEVGLGGRLDATNVVSPLVTAITSIGYDHQQYLGTTLAAIAREKAGIIKPGIPVIVGDLGAEAAGPIAEVARERGAPHLVASAGVTLSDEGALAGGGHRIRLRTARRDYGVIDLALAGAHQVGNACVAVRVLEAVDEHGVTVPADAIVHGLHEVQWPGRLERRRLPGGRELLLDAAHNPEGAQALARYLASDFTEAGKPGRPGGPGRAGGDDREHTRPAMVFTAMKDKDVRDMLRVLTPEISTLVLTRALTPRGADPQDLAAVAREVGVTCPVVVEPVIREALESAWARTQTIVVAGSIFLLGDVLELLDRDADTTDSRRGS